MGREKERGWGIERGGGEDIDKREKGGYQGR
jgi:hypothetical protein